MLLAVEIDNSAISFGLFEDENLIKHFSMATDVRKTSDEYAVILDGILRFHNIEKDQIHAAAVASVVPQLTEVILAVIKNLTGLDALTVGKGIKTGFPIKIDNPAELGADLVANAAAVLALQQKETKNKKPCVMIDMGTATTVFAINGAGEYIGGSILPGIGISLEALHGNTAQLPSVSPTGPIRAIGKNSQEAVRSGVLLGNAMMIDGFIDRFAEEMKSREAVSVFVTGEYARTVIPFCKHEARYIPELTLLGIACIYRNNL